MWKIVICCAVLSSVSAINNPKHDLVKLSIIHINDIHARFEETSRTSTRCVENCIGGFSRLYTAINDLFLNEPDSILLNAGDSFQGTLWYNLHKWNVTQYFLNKLPTDAYTLGNHEFDDGIDGVVPFINALNCPVVVANMDVSKEPRMHGIFKKSTIVYRNNMKIGVVGVIVANTNVISRSENIIFTDEVTSVNREADRLMKQENCSTIIVLSHCGIDIDKIIARHAVPGISLIVGGHSHTFLYSGNKLPGPDIPEGPYPTVVSNKNGKNVLIVQAHFNTKYVGNISIWYNKLGEVDSWDGTPIYMDSKIRKDEYINREIAEWKKSVDDHGNTILGSSNVLLDRDTRRSGESNIGSFLTDAMVDYYVSRADNESWTYASIAIINSGAIRTSIPRGNITVSDLVSAQPFGNTIDCVELTGQNIKHLLEYSVTPSIVRPDQFHEFLQVSGIRVTFDISQPIGSRVVRLKLRCRHCDIPNYFDVNYAKSYRVLIPTFLIMGGDGYSIIPGNMKNREIGVDDISVYSKYISKVSPITQGHDERIVMKGTFNNVHSGQESNHSISLTYSFMSLVAVYSVTAMYYVQLCFVI